MGLGAKDFSLAGNGLDANKNDDAGVIEQLPIHGLYMPDALAAFDIGANTYIISANEGDGREYEGTPGHVDETDLKDVALDAGVFSAGFITRAADTDDIGDLTIIDAMGNTDGDPELEEIYCYGTRSFSIWSGADGSLVYDSGDMLEQTTLAAYPANFNASNDDNAIDDRSDNKGPEPEAVTTAMIGGRTYAFVGLERIGGVLIVDVTDPTAPVQEQYVNNRDFSKDPETELAQVGDLGPEGIVIIPASEHPQDSDIPLMVVTNEVSGTITVYELKTMLASSPVVPDLPDSYWERPTWTWDPVNGATGYVVSLDGGPEEAVGELRYTPDTNLSVGKHTLQVWAVDGDGVRSQPTSATVNILPRETYVIDSPTGDIRVATFNAYLNRTAEGELLTDLTGGADTQAQAVAEIIQRTRPDIVLLNEFDYVAGGTAVDAFRDEYLEVSQNGAAAITYDHYFLAPSNTGTQPATPQDFDNNGSTGEAGDAFGFGEFTGQYGMVLLSRYPIDTGNVRTFQQFLWKDMPGALLPPDPNDTDGDLDTDNFYTAAELDIFRLSSKSHWDVPVTVGEDRIHLLCSHPTPPVFDDGNDGDLDGSDDTSGDPIADWNGRRNHDEIRFWADYVTPSQGGYIYDDDGVLGGIPDEDPFVVLGDQNASPVEGDSTGPAIQQLLFAPTVSSTFVPTSPGGPENDTGNPHATSHTADWKMRVDYVLPSNYGVIPENGSVFWPRTIDDLHYLVGPNVVSSDHRMVWMDLTFGEPVQGEMVVRVQVAASDDDAEELDMPGDPDHGAMDIDSSDLELTEEHPGDGDYQYVGVRFTNVAVPAGARILEAYIQFAQDENKSAAPFSLSITGEAADSAAAYADELHNISTRPTTWNTVAWEGTEEWAIENEAGPNQRTPNLAAIVQEIVDRPGWASGNPVAFVITGTGTRHAESYDGDATLAPTLRLVYTQNRVCSRIAASDDDAEELDMPGDPDHGTLDITSSDLELTEEHPGDGDDQFVGLRFTNMAIPKGVHVKEAYIQFAQDENKSAAPFSLTIAGEASDSAAAYVDELNNISNRSATWNTVTWEGTQEWAVENQVGPNQRTPNLANIVQEIIDRDGWATGNPIAFVITGTGTRHAESYDGDPALAPRLCVTYSPDFTCSRVSAGTDDAEELDLPGDPDHGAMDIDSSDLELTEEHPGDGDYQYVGLRFANVAVPDGAAIVNAYIQFAQDETKSAAPFSLTIAGEAADSATTYADVLNDISSRPTTWNTVAWEGTEEWAIENEVGPNQRTPNLAAIVQEIVDRDGWTTGNPIAFVITGTGTRHAESYDGDPELAPKLCVEYTMDAVDVRVAASTDDAEELDMPGDPDHGAMDIDSSDLELTEEHPGDGDYQFVGIRFNGLAIPEGVNITEAYIQFAQDESKSTAPFDLTIAGEAADNAVTYADVLHDISSRSTTTATVAWSGTEGWETENEVGPNQRTPDLSDIVQEIIDRDGWTTGNSLAFVITGTGTRHAESYDGDPALAPKLSVRWTQQQLYTPAAEEEVEPTHGKYRLVWNDDPATTMTVGWHQESGANPAVYYSTDDPAAGRTDLTAWMAAATRHEPDRVDPYRGMDNTFARLAGLQPDTAYYFVVADDTYTSDVMWFRTAPDTPQPFTFISGGDTKSFGDAYTAGIQSFSLVPKLRPLFIEFNGDFCSGDGTDDASWALWLNDWATITKAEDGRMFPILPVHGNHENGDFEMLNRLFDTPAPDPQYPYSYYSLSFAGGLLKTIVLNSEIDGEVDAWTAQNSWLETELQNSLGHTFVTTGYHKPVRPHTAGKGENDYLMPWAELFTQYGVNLSFDADSHMHKITFPIRPCTPQDDPAECWEGFIRDDINGTMYVGEGSWGAWARPADDDKPWTLDSAQMQQFKWLQVFPADGRAEARIDIRTVITGTHDEEGDLVDHTADVGALTEDDVFAIPANIDLVDIPYVGTVVTYPFEAPVGDPPTAPTNLVGQATSYTEIDLTWDAATNASKLYLDRKIEPDGDYVLVDNNITGDATTYSQEHLNDGTSYTYRIRAHNLFGFSAYSNEVTVTTPVDQRTRAEFQQGLQGYAGAVDIEIREPNSDANFEGQTTISVDNNSGNGDRQHALMRFNDILGEGSGQIPANATITSAVLRVWTVSTTTYNISLHRMLVDWTAAETWNSMTDGLQTDDVEMVAIADAMQGNMTSGQYHFFDVTTSLQEWHTTRAPNYGWGLVNDGSDGWDFYAAEWAVQEQRPLLTVYYVVDEDDDNMNDEWEKQIVDADSDDDIVTVDDVLPGDDFDNDDLDNGTEHDALTDPLGWLLVMSVSGAGPDYTRVGFGMQAGASEDADEFDEDAPLAPPLGNPEVYFDQLRLTYARDIRPISNGDEWFLLVAAGPDADVTLSWDANGIVGDQRHLIMFEVDPQLKPVPNGFMDMKLENGLTVPAGEEHYFIVRYGAEMSFDVHFVPGWNLVSLPFEPLGDNSVDVLLDDGQGRGEENVMRDGRRGTIHAGAVWAWRNEGMTGRYEYVAVDRLEAMIGYWVFAEQAGTVTITGLPVANPELVFNTGWNLFGVNQSMPLPDAETYHLRSGAWEWNATDGQYYDAQQLEPGLGYWLNFGQDHVVVPLETAP